MDAISSKRRCASPSNARSPAARTDGARTGGAQIRRRAGHAPTALPAGASPGFEETAPGAEFVAEKAEVSLAGRQAAAAVPQGPQEPDQEPPGRLGGPVDIKETVIPFPTPRPQPTTPPEMPFRYPPMPQIPAAQPAARRQTPPPAAPTTPPEGTGVRGIPVWLAVHGRSALPADRRVSSQRCSRSDGATRRTRRKALGRKVGTPARCRRRRRRSRRITCPKVRRALREDRVLAAA
jgi:hypothetical protein